MKQTVTIIATALIFLFCSTKVEAQELFEDGSMKLSEVSTNKKYGYKSKPKTSIKVGSIENEQAYLKALRGPTGEPVKFRRIGSCCEFKSKSAAFGSAFLDKYEVYYKGINEPVNLYLNGYEFETPKAPLGFTFVTADKIEAPYIYPADSIVKVNYCNKENQYAVGKEFLLKKAMGEMAEPDSNPNFEGGLAQLKKYFEDKPLTDERTKNNVFRVTIAFVVDCKGKAGTYMIISKGKGRLATFANQVLARVNNLPQNWTPALKDGNKVDCYQVLSFTIARGQLTKVSYR